MKELEHTEQCELIAWARSKVTLEKYPELRFLAAWPNGGYRNKRTAVKLKAEGVQPGPFDLHLDVPKGNYHGLRIEMKAPAKDGKRKGRLSKEQVEWLAHYLANDYYACVCRCADEAKMVIKRYLSL